MGNLRSQTADLLNNGCSCGPMPPPQGTMDLNTFQEMMWRVVYNSGYYGNKKEFLDAFAALMNQTAISLPGIITQVGSVNDLPTVGQDNAIYVLTDTKQLYFWQDGKGYVKVTGSGVSGSVTTEDVQEALDGQTIFVGGNAESNI